MTADEPLVTLWVIYYGVKDRPGPYTVRAQTHSPAYGLMVAPDAADFLTLADARASLPPGLYNLGRQPNDDPAIVEVWI